MAHLADITFNSSLIPASQTDFVFGVDMADLPASVHAVLTSDAGDVRLFKSDGTTELAREIQFYDAANDTGYFWFKFSGTLVSTSDTVVQFHADGVSTEPAFTAPNGRNEVWTGYTCVLHLQTDFRDSTGVNTFVATGGTVTQNVGSATFAGGFLRATGVTNYDVTSGYIYQLTGPIDDITTQAAWTGHLDAGGSFSIYRSGTSTTSGRWDHGAHLTTGRAVQGWDGLDTFKTYRWDGSAVYTYIDEIGTPQTYTAVPAPGATLDLMGRDGDGLTGTIREIRLSKGDRNADWVITEARNLLEPTFYTITEVAQGVGNILPNTIGKAAEEFQEVHFSTVGNSHVTMVGNAKVDGTTALDVVLGTDTASLPWNGTRYEGPATAIATALSTEVGNDVDDLSFLYVQEYIVTAGVASTASGYFRANFGTVDPDIRTALYNYEVTGFAHDTGGTQPGDFGFYLTGILIPQDRLYSIEITGITDSGWNGGKTTLLSTDATFNNNLGGSTVWFWATDAMVNGDQYQIRVKMA